MDPDFHVNWKIFFKSLNFTMIIYFILFVCLSVRSVPETKAAKFYSIAVAITFWNRPHFQLVYIKSTQCPDFRSNN